MHSDKYEMVASWWDRWHSETMVDNAVKKQWITKQEAEQIKAAK